MFRVGDRIKIVAARPVNTLLWHNPGVVVYIEHNIYYQDGIGIGCRLVDHKADWLRKDAVLVFYANQIVLLEQFPNQKCIGCNKSAPHQIANAPDNKFICISCKMIESLDV